MAVAMTAPLNTAASVLETGQRVGAEELWKTMVLMTQFIITFYGIVDPGSEMS